MTAQQSSEQAVSKSALERIIPNLEIINRADPEQLTAQEDLRCFYDPAQRFADRPFTEMLDAAAKTRHAGVVANLGILAGHELVVAETTHVLLGDERTDLFPVEPGRQRQIRDAVHVSASQTARSAGQKADELIHLQAKRRALYPFACLDDTVVPLLVAARTVAVDAQAEMELQSPLPQYAHPDEVSSILLAAWRKWMPDSQSRIRRRAHELTRYQFAVYMHNAHQDMLDPRGEYLSRRMVVASPLAARKLLELYDEPAAAELAGTLPYLYRAQDTTGQRLEYSDHVARGVAKAGKSFVAVKAAVVQRNRHISPEIIIEGDEKARRKYRQRPMYDRAMQQLMVASEKVDDMPFAFVVHSIAATR